MATTDKIILLICGSGNGAHALAAIASSQSNTEARILTLTKERAECWSESISKEDFTVTIFKDGEKSEELKTKPAMITNDPGQAVPGCDVIAFVLAAFAHEQYLHAIKPYLKPEMTLVGFPGQAGFDFQVNDILGDLASQITLVNYESLPWVARISEFGKSCDVLGTKSALMGAFKVGSSEPFLHPENVVQKLIGNKPRVLTKGHLLAVSLMSFNAILHTSILYGKWVDWDGQPLSERPFFYEALSEETAELLSSMSDEVRLIADAIAAQGPQYDMSKVVHLHYYYCDSYKDDVDDMTSLYTAIRSNAAYKGLVHPMKQTGDGKWLPDFVGHRYFTEDIPYGLVVIRGIADIMDVPTPNIDKVLLWAQGLMGKEYLVDGEIKGLDVKNSRAPQRYGIKSLEDMD